MDTSEIYIKMCERAREIQDVSLSFGDYYWFNKDWHIFLEGAYAMSPEHFVWLPRQDQLQEMIGSMGDCLSLVYGWLEEGGIGDYYNYDRHSFISESQ